MISSNEKRNYDKRQKDGLIFVVFLVKQLKVSEVLEVIEEPLNNAQQSAKRWIIEATKPGVQVQIIIYDDS